jgi:hypothetical protein
MTVKGWLVVFGAIVFGLILASCSSNHHDDGASGGSMSCADQQAFLSSGQPTYVQEGDRWVAINPLGQRYVLSDRESQAGFMIDRCQSTGGYTEQGYQGRDNDDHRGRRRR